MSATDRDLIARFIEMMAAEQGVAANTSAAYASDLLAASSLTGGKLAHANADNLVTLSSHWRDLANSSVARKSSVLRRFFGFLHEEGFRDDNPSAALPKPAQVRALPKIETAGRTPDSRSVASTNSDIMPKIRQDSRAVALFSKASVSTPIFSFSLSVIAHVSLVVGGRYFC